MIVCHIPKKSLLRRSKGALQESFFCETFERIYLSANEKEPYLLVCFNHELRVLYGEKCFAEQAQKSAAMLP